MAAKPLTKAEKAWIEKVQALLRECPSKRIAGYTIGDNDIVLYDTKFDDEIRAIQDDGADFCSGVNATGAELERLYFTFPIHSTAG